MAAKKKVQKKSVKDIKVEETKCCDNCNCSKSWLWIIGGIVLVAIVVLILVLTLSSTGVQSGDTVSVNYILRLEDGKVFDTNIETVAVENGLNKSSYTPLTFTVGKEQVVPGFENGVKGMDVGETKSFTVSAEDGYGSIDENRILSLPLIQKMDKYQVIEKQLFMQLFNAEPEVNKVYSAEALPWDLKVMSFNETSVNLENILTVGQEIQSNQIAWTSEVVEVNNDSIKTLQHPKVGDGILLPSQGTYLSGKVASVDAENFTIDFNSPLAGKTLNFEVTLLSVIPEDNINGTTDN